MSTVDAIAADLAAEHADLDQLLDGRPASDWARPTPSPGWTVADQVGHLAYFDRTATMAIVSPDAFGEHVSELLGAAAEGADMDSATLADARSMGPAALLAEWRSARDELIGASATLTEDVRVPWYGPSMGARSFLTARLMETWAHGQDVADALGVRRAATERLRHVAQIGVITRGWSYSNRGLDAPEVPVRVELQAPSGEHWQWGDEDAGASVTGTAEDFCLVVTQRRHVDDTSLRLDGAAAREWMELAQAFAGAPTDGPAARTTSRVERR